MIRTKDAMSDGILRNVLRSAIIDLCKGPKRAVCFSATANFVGSGVLGAIGVVTLTKVKHRREILFATLPLYSPFISSSRDLSGWDWMDSLARGCARYGRGFHAVCP